MAKQTSPPLNPDIGRPARSWTTRWIGYGLLVLVVFGTFTFWSKWRAAARHLRVAAFFEGMNGRVEGDWNWKTCAYEPASITLSVPGMERQVTDAELPLFEYLEPVESVDLAQCYRVTDEGLRALSRLRNLKVLSLADNGDNPGPRITDAGLEHLRGLATLTVLALGGSAVGDKGLERLAALPNLQFLDLEGTRVTDAGLRHLRRFPSLKTVMLERTAVTAEGARDLQRALPTLEIHHETFDALPENPKAPDDGN
jgi:hypothetical protein